jgi:hypothetical protein
MKQTSLQTILQFFRQTYGLEIFTPRQISDRSRELQAAVVTPMAINSSSALNH